MTRPCFLVVDRDQPGSLSTRKLVIETAKVNVITAYSGPEALAMIERFPAVDGIVVDAGMPDVSCAELVLALKQRAPGIPVVAVGTPTRGICQGADYFEPSFDPAKLLDLLRGLVPKVDKVMQHDQQVQGGRAV